MRTIRVNRSEEPSASFTTAVLAGGSTRICASDNVFDEGIVRHIPPACHENQLREILFHQNVGMRVNQQMKTTLSKVEYTGIRSKDALDQCLRKLDAFMNVKQHLPDLSYFRPTTLDKTLFQTRAVETVTSIYATYVQNLGIATQDPVRYSKFVPYLIAPQIRFSGSSVKQLRSGSFTLVIAHTVLDAIITNLEKSIAVPFMLEDGVVAVAFIKNDRMPEVSKFFVEVLNWKSGQKEKILTLEEMVTLVERHKASITSIVDGRRTDFFPYSTIDFLLRAPDYRNTVL